MHYQPHFAEKETKAHKEKVAVMPMPCALQADRDFPAASRQLP